MTSHPDIAAINDLKELIAEDKIIPFIGAGFSLSLGLPSWNVLIEFIAKQLDYDPEIFATQGNHLQLVDYYLIRNNGDISQLAEKLRRWFNNKAINIADSEQHMLLSRLNASLIYTTNYDTLIERAFEATKQDFGVVVTGRDIRKAEAKARQVIKFHGDLDAFETMVLSEQHFFSRLNLESALDIKLRSDLLGRSLLFIGYGFQDINLRFLWYKLREQWRNKAFPGEREPLSYFVGFGVGEIQRTVLRSQFNIVTIELEPKDKVAMLVNLLKYLI